MALDRDDLVSTKQRVTHEESLAAAAEIQVLFSALASESKDSESVADELLHERRVDTSLD